MFEQALLEAPAKGTRGVTLAASLTMQMLTVGTALMVPLFLIDGPGMVKLTSSLMAPPAPPPPAIPIELVNVPKSLVGRNWDGSKLIAPQAIPKNVPYIDDEAMPPAGPITTGVEGGTGIPGSPNIEGLVGAIPRVAPPPPQPKVEAVEKKPEPVVAKRVTVSSGVQAAKIINRVLPVYPALAKQARISGSVKLMGVLSRDGRIMQLQVLSGHPLLVKAAVDAVSQWIYQPTLLNGEPVEVIAPIDVNFVLGQ